MVSTCTWIYGMQINSNSNSKVVGGYYKYFIGAVFCFVKYVINCYIYIYTYIYMHNTYIHTYIHTYTHTCIHTYMYAHVFFLQNQSEFIQIKIYYMLNTAIL
jgi:hypothetical protein